jgi:hypothetical protein
MVLCLWFCFFGFAVLKLIKEKKFRICSLAAQGWREPPLPNLVKYLFFFLHEAHLLNLMDFQKR